MKRLLDPLLTLLILMSVPYEVIVHKNWDRGILIFTLAVCYATYYRVLKLDKKAMK